MTDSLDFFNDLGGVKNLKFHRDFSIILSCFTINFVAQVGLYIVT